MAVKIEDVVETLRETGIPQDKINAVVKELQKVEEAAAEERAENKAPKQKTNFVVLTMDDGKLQAVDLLGYIVQIPEDKQSDYAITAIYDAVRDYNNTARKAKKYPVTLIGEAMETLRGRFLKERKIKIKTKQSVKIVPVKNEIPDPKKRPANG